MKMTPEHFATLERGLIATLQAHNLSLSTVRNLRDAWDCFHKACNEHYVDWRTFRNYNDAHIETAMKHIFK